MKKKLLAIQNVPVAWVVNLYSRYRKCIGYRRCYPDTATV